MRDISKISAFMFDSSWFALGALFFSRLAHENGSSTFEKNDAFHVLAILLESKRGKMSVEGVRRVSDFSRKAKSIPTDIKFPGVVGKAGKGDINDLLRIRNPSTYSAFGTAPLHVRFKAEAIVSVIEDIWHCFINLRSPAAWLQ